MKPHIQAAGIDTIIIANQPVSKTPNRRWRKPNTNLALASLPKGTTAPDQCRALLGEFKDHQREANFIFTDGSKSGEKVGSAAVRGVRGSGAYVMPRRKWQWAGAASAYVRFTGSYQEKRR